MHQEQRGWPKPNWWLGCKRATLGKPPHKLDYRSASRTPIGFGELSDNGVRRHCKMDGVVFYIDGHRKAVYADHLIPCGLVGRQGKVLGCRALVVLHDQAGHPPLVTTHRGDQHLTVGLPGIIAHYEQAAGLHRLERVVVDREGMAAEFLAALAAEYAHASWQRLQVFFQLPGRIHWGRDRVEVELKPFNDRAFN